MTQRIYTVTVNGGGYIAYKGERREDAYAAFLDVLLNQTTIDAKLTVQTFNYGRLSDERSVKVPHGMVAVTNLEARPR